jgi:hypothetical protein
MVVKMSWGEFYGLSRLRLRLGGDMLTCRVMDDHIHKTGWRYCLILLAVAFILIYGRFLTGWSPSGGDIVNQYLPYQELVREAVRAGELPLYNSKTFCGRPLMADIQVGVLYPPNWLHWILPLPLSFALVLAFHGFWMILGCILLGRTWKLHPAAIALGTILFCANPFFTLKLGQGIILFIYVGAWWPWLGLTVTRLIDRPCFPRMLVFTLCTSMSLLAGSPQITFYGWIATCALACFLVCGKRIKNTPPGGISDTTPTSPWKPLGWIFCGFLCTAGLTALQTFQTMDFIRHSFERSGGAPWEYITDGSLDLHHLWLMINPSFLGIGHSENALYFGSRLDFAEACTYLPIWTLFILLPLTLMKLRGKGESAHTRQHSWLLYAGLLSISLGLGLALGKHSPLFNLFFNFIPGFDKFRVPIRLMVFFFSGLSLVCMVGYHRLLTWDVHPRPGRLKGLILGGSSIGLLLVWIPFMIRDRIWEPIMEKTLDGPWLINGHVPKQIEPIYDKAVLVTFYNGIIVSLGLVVSAVVLWILLKKKPDSTGRQNRLIWVLPALALVELFILLLPSYRTSHVNGYIDDHYPTTPLINILNREHRGGRILWLDDVPSWCHDQNQPEIYPNRLVMHGLPDARGYDPVNARWIGEWMNLLSGRDPDANPRGLMMITKIVLPAWLTLMGVDTVLSYQDLDEINSLRLMASLEFDEEQFPGKPPPDPNKKETLRIYRNEAFRGLAFAAPMPKFVKPGPWQHQLYAAARIAEDPAMTFREAIVTDNGIYLGSSFIPTEPGRQREEDFHLAMETGPGFTMEELQAGPNTWRYRVNFPSKALTCFSHSAWDGWNLKINGKPASLARMNGTFLAGAVPAGASELELSFKPPRFTTGGTISLISLVILLYGCLRSRFVRIT